MVAAAEAGLPVLRTPGEHKLLTAVSGSRQLRIVVLVAEIMRQLVAWRRFHSSS